MMQEEKRALYNSIRMNWFYDQSFKAELWQVEDYRKIPAEALFERLKHFKLAFDKVSFSALAEHADSPEELTEQLLADSDFDAGKQDQVYLIIFELWRKLLPERLCLSVFCDELDHRIFQYDTGVLSHPDSIADILANLKIILDENVDSGINAHEAFQSIITGCANDIESFLYDFTTEQLDSDNISYASELVESFYDYVEDVKWFDFLKVRVLSNSDFEVSLEEIKKIILSKEGEIDLEFNLEMLSFLVQGEDQKIFYSLVKKTLPLIQFEEDFQDLLNLSADFFRNLDREKQEKAILEILQARAKYSVGKKVSNTDPHRRDLVKIME